MNPSGVVRNRLLKFPSSDRGNALLIWLGSPPPRLEPVGTTTIHFPAGDLPGLSYSILGDPGVDMAKLLANIHLPQVILTLIKCLDSFSAPRIWTIQTDLNTSGEYIYARMRKRASSTSCITSGQRRMGLTGKNDHVRNSVKNWQRPEECPFSCGALLSRLTFDSQNSPGWSRFEIRSKRN